MNSDHSLCILNDGKKLLYDLYFWRSPISKVPKSQDETQMLINEVREIDRDQLMKELFDDFDSDSDSKPTGSDQRKAKAEIS
jgi:hypothetical protein